MAKNSGFSIGRFILQLALGLMLAIAGIWSLANNKGDAAVAALRKDYRFDFLCNRNACWYSFDCRTFCRR